MNTRRNRRRWYRYSLGSLFVLTTLVAMWFGLGPRVRAYWAVQRLANDDLRIDGTTIGMMVVAEGDLADEFRRLGVAANPALQDALGDPDKFAAAHIWLTLVNSDGFAEARAIPIVVFMPLRVDLDGKGIHFHPEQIPQLQESWRQRLAIRRAHPGR